MDIWTLLPFSPEWSPLVIATLVLPDLVIRVVALAWLPYRRKPSVALGWLMAIFLIPYIGILTFLFMGSTHLPHKRRDRQRTITELTRAQTQGTAIIGEHGLPEHLATAAQLNYSLGALPMTHGNDFRLLTDNNAAIGRMAELVRGATAYVHFCFYIVAEDSTSEPLIDELVAAHRRGVRVRMLIDHIGSLGYPGYRRLVRRLDAEGIRWRRALPVRPWLGEYQRPDLRNHRKILVVDDRVAVTGSQNIIDHTYNLRRNLRAGFVWKDLMIEATGPVVVELDTVFGSDWYSETGEILTEDLQLSVVGGQRGQGVLAQVVPSGPDFPLENNLRLFNHLIYNANHRIVICSPYFVPDESLLSALITEAHSGTDVRIYVGESSNHGIVQRAQESYYEELAEAGVHIMRYPAPTVLHAKFLLVDDEVTVIGSSNMDQRSFALCLEVSTFVVSHDFTAELYAFEEAELRTRSTELDLARWRRRSVWKKSLENVSRLASSLL
jgi:cardiolipin synthase